MQFWQETSVHLSPHPHWLVAIWLPSSETTLRSGHPPLAYIVDKLCPLVGSASPRAGEEPVQEADAPAQAPEGSGGHLHQPGYSALYGHLIYSISFYKSP